MKTSLDTNNGVNMVFGTGHAKINTMKDAYHFRYRYSLSDNARSLLFSDTSLAQVAHIIHCPSNQIYWQK